jgi:hypothetical protein
VPNPSRVKYYCPKGSDPSASWPPGAFSLSLEASAGKPGCRDSNQATALVTITDKPSVQLNPPATAVAICEDEQATTVNVTFSVQATTENGANVEFSAPLTAQSSDGRMCTRQSLTDSE